MTHEQKTNILYRCQVPSSYDLGVKMFLKCWGKHRENRKKLKQERLVSCWGVKLSLLKDVTITTVTTTTLTYVTITTVTIRFFSFVTVWFFLVLSFDFLSFVTIWFFEFYYNLTFWVLSQFDFFEFYHNLIFWVLSQLYFWSFITIWFFLVLSKKFRHKILIKKF